MAMLVCLDVEGGVVDRLSMMTRSEARRALLTFRRRSFDAFLTPLTSDFRLTIWITGFAKSVGDKARGVGLATLFKLTRGVICTDRSHHEATIVHTIRYNVFRNQCFSFRRQDHLLAIVSCTRSVSPYSDHDNVGDALEQSCQRPEHRIAVFSAF